MVESDITNISQFLLGMNIDISQPILMKYQNEQQKIKNNSLHDVKEVSIEDFEILNVISKGSSDKVLLVEHKKTLEKYAMKCFKKELLLEQDLIDSTLIEKKIIQSINHNFIISMDFCFQSEDKLILVMPFMM